MPTIGWCDPGSPPAVADRKSRVSIRCYADLHDFLAREDRQRDLEVRFFVPPTVKDVIESLGIPHVEVALVVVNGEPVGFDHRPADGDRICAYPAFRTLDLGPIAQQTTHPPERIQFVADVHLRKLARLLRLLGVDVVYSSRSTHAELLAVSGREARILLTRDRVLLRHGCLTRGYWVRSSSPEEQAVEVVRRFRLFRHVSPWSRCPRCNGLVRRIDKRAALPRIPPKTALWLDEYVECSVCGQLYWRGTHTQRLAGQVQRILARAQTP